MNPLIDPGTLYDIAIRWADNLWLLTIKSSVLLAVFGLLTVLLRRASASTRHLVWTVGVVCVVILPLFASGLPQWQVAGWPSSPFMQTTAQAESTTTPPMPNTPSEVRPSVSLSTLGESENLQPYPPILHPKGGESFVAREKARDKARENDPQTGTLPQLVGRKDPEISSSQSSLTPSREEDTRSILWPVTVSLSPVVWMFFVWQAGVILLLGILVTGALRLSWLRYKAVSIHAVRWRDLLDTLSKDLGIRREVTLLRSDRDITPMTWGVRRPIVMLPASCDAWTMEQRREVLVHELAHVKRRDCLTQSLAQIACVAYWFNPLVWFAARRLRTERERACDDHVLLAGAKASSYAGHLLQIACTLDSENRSIALSVAMARRSQLSGRLVALLDPKLKRYRPGRVAIAAVFLLALGLVLPLATAGPGGSPATAAPITEYAAASAAAARAKTSATGAREDDRIKYRNGKTQWQYVEDDHRLSIELDGDIEFNEDETDIAWMSDDAYFELEEKRDGKKRRIEIEPGEDGKPEHRYFEGRKEIPYDVEAAAWLAKVLQKTVRQMSFAADVRVRRTYEKEGFAGVLQEIEDIESDYSRSRYYEEAMALEQLNAVNRSRLLEHAAEQLESDHNKAQLLLQSLDMHGLQQEIQPGYLDLAASIDSDYEKGRTLRAAVESGRLESQAIITLLEVAQEIDSDHELAQLLSGIQPEQLTDSELRQAYFMALDNLDSDFERGRALQSVLKQENLDQQTAMMALEAVSDMDSDFETTKILLQIAPHYSENDQMREHFFTAVNEMDSDYQRGQVLAVFLEHEDISPACMMSVLESIEELDSDFEKGKLLIIAAPHCAHDDVLLEAYEEASDSIDSEHEYGRVMKALRNAKKSI